MFHHRQMHFGDVPSNSESHSVPSHQHNTFAFPPLNLSRISPHQHAAALEYDTYLRQLTFNSKEMITNLTRIAGENMDSCEAIAMTVEQRTFHAPPLLKLPFLYLMDSIVKNIGGNYIPCFSANLFNSFTTAYDAVPPQIRISMHRLLNTWPPYFGLDIVAAMHHAISDQGAASDGRPNIMAMSQSHSAGHQGHMLTIPPSQPPRLPQMPHSAPYHIRNSVPPRPLPAVPPPVSLMTGELGVLPTVTPNFPPSIVPDNRPRIRSQPISGTNPRVPAGPVADRVNTASGGPADFLRTQDMMQDIIRKASMGTAPSNHQLFNMNRLITTQLQNAATLPAQRDTLLRFQQQLRQAASIPHQQHGRVNSAPIIPSAPVMTSIPFPIGTPLPIQNMNVPVTSPTSSMSVLPPPPPPSLLQAIGRSQALSGLLRSIPSGLLSTASAGVSSHVVSPGMAHFAAQQPGISHAMSSMGMQSSSMGVVPNALQSEAPMYQSHSSSPLDFNVLKTISHAAAVRALYVELPLLSKSDGMRFSTKEKLRDHLDWVFQRNRRKRAIANKESLGGHSRCWFDTVSSFLKQGDSTTHNKDKTTGSGDGGASDSRGGGINKGAIDLKTAADNDSRKNAVPVKGDSEVCGACGEAFETFWDDDKHSWMLADAIRVDESGVFHTKCLESTQVVGESESEHPTSEKTGDDSIPTTPNVNGANTKAETTEQPKLKVDILSDSVHVPKQDNKTELHEVKNEITLEGGVVKLQDNKKSVDPVKTESELLDPMRTEMLSDAELVSGGKGSRETQHEDEKSISICKEGGQKRKREETEVLPDTKATFDSAEGNCASEELKEGEQLQKRIKVGDEVNVASVSSVTHPGVNKAAVNPNELDSAENSDPLTETQETNMSLESHSIEDHDQSTNQDKLSTGNAVLEGIGKIFEEKRNVPGKPHPVTGAALKSTVE